jgi:phage terminase small subunit
MWEALERAGPASQLIISRTRFPEMANNVRKPAGLIARAETKADKQARADKETKLRPRHKLAMQAPARIKDIPTAAAMWRKMIRLYSEMQAEIVTSLDYGLLEDYCLTIDEMDELRNMRTVAYKLWLELGQAHEAMLEQKMQDEAAFVAINVVGAFDAVIKLDARMDRKKDLLHKLRQSLYLTPRARAGIAPEKKTEAPPPDDMERMLDDVTDYVNGDHVQ